MNQKYNGQNKNLVEHERQTRRWLQSSLQTTRTMLFALIVSVYMVAASPAKGAQDQTTNSITSSQLGSSWYVKGEYDKAIEYFQQALASEIDNFGEAHPNVATIRNNLALAWKAKGQYDKAIAYYELALASQDIELSRHHPLWEDM